MGGIGGTTPLSVPASLGGGVGGGMGGMTPESTSGAASIRGIGAMNASPPASSGGGIGAMKASAPASSLAVSGTVGTGIGGLALHPIADAAPITAAPRTVARRTSAGTLGFGVKRGGEDMGVSLPDRAA